MHCRVDKWMGGEEKKELTNKQETKMRISNLDKCQ